MISIKNLDKAEVLKALWQHSHTQGVSFLGVIGLKDGKFTIEHARDLVESNPRLYFDYVDGHIIKCDLSGDEFDERLYDRDCGAGMAQRAIDHLRKEMEMLEHPYKYDGTVITLKVENAKDNDKIANAFHEAFKGKQEYIDSAVILNKDPDSTTGKEQTAVYICTKEVKNFNSIVDSVANVLKSLHEDFI